MFELVTLTDQKGLASLIARSLGKNLVIPEVLKFADGEIGIRLPANDVKGKIVFIVQSTNPPVQEHLMRLLFTTHALKNAGAAKVIGIIPYFGYARHDKSAIAGKPGDAY